jgi:hypothetical protein
LIRGWISKGARTFAGIPAADGANQLAPSIALPAKKAFNASDEQGFVSLGLSANAGGSLTSAP